MRVWLLLLALQALASQEVASAFVVSSNSICRNSFDGRPGAGHGVPRSTSSQGRTSVATLSMLQIKPLEVAEASSVANFFVNSFWASGGITPGQANRLAKEQALDLKRKYSPPMRGQKKAQGVFLVATDKEDSYVGCAGVDVGPVGYEVTGLQQLRADEARPRPLLSNVTVSFKARRKGVAKKLVRECEKTVKEWGFDEMTLLVREDNKAAVRLYKKLGYKTLSKNPYGKTLKVTPSSLQNVPCTTVFMRKSLSGPLESILELFGQ